MGEVVPSPKYLLEPLVPGTFLLEVNPTEETSVRGVFPKCLLEPFCASALLPPHPLPLRLTPPEETCVLGAQAR